MHLRVVDRPEAVEHEDALVPLRDRDHHVVRLVADAVVDVDQLDRVHHRVNRVLLRDRTVAGQERATRALVVGALDKRVRGVAVRLNRGHDDSPELILLLPRLPDGLGATLNGPLVDAAAVFDREGNVLDTVAVLSHMIAHLLVARVEGRLEDEDDLVETASMAHNLAVAGLQAAVPDALKAKAAGVEGRSLLGIAHPESDVVESQVAANIRLGALVSVARHGGG